MSQTNRQTAQIVAEIFSDVGVAFTRLGELEMLLNPESDSKVKFSETDVIALRAAIVKFGQEIDKICQRIKDRTLLQIRNSMKRHAYEEAGLPLRKQQVVGTPKAAVAVKTEKVETVPEKVRTAAGPNLPVMTQPTVKSADITLNMLNATEQEVDVEGLATSDKLDYDCTDGS